MCHDEQGHFGLEKTLRKSQRELLVQGNAKEYGIKHVLNATATPRANGQVERVNSTVVSALAASGAGAEEDDWDLFAKKVQSGINNTPNRTTRQCPSQLLYGFKPRSTAGASLLAATQDTLDAVDLTELRRRAGVTTDDEQERQKAKFDSKRFKAPRYAVHDIVMVTTEQPATGTGGELLAKAKGPFEVAAFLPNNRCEVEDLREMKKGRGR
ncbi:uncharacterized protein LOC122502386 [Leptopilina heterotoma]|uniref:uncharacterized protein LOC122502386 n=1 Tax=Leptopilina heterotoma TaxID=63436 RepID=UPI001CA7E2A9|nr:uncharacterized protein LOC122502386 [Leptopilina heterotoma]